MNHEHVARLSSERIPQTNFDFERYAREHTPRLLRLAGVLSNDPALAEDLVQEVLIRAHGRWDHISSLPHPHAYVRRMVCNEYLSWRRKWGRVLSRPPDAFDYGSADNRSADNRSADNRSVDSGSVDPSIAVDDRDELRAEIVQLPAKQRTAIVLRYFEDLPDAEIAVILSCRQSTVRGYIHRGLKAMRISLTGPGPSRPDPSLLDDGLRVDDGLPPAAAAHRPRRRPTNPRHLDDSGLSLLERDI